MGKFRDLTGQVFGRLTAIEYIPGSRKARSKWKCVCECGKEVLVSTCNLQSGGTKSCGCLGREKTAMRNTSHGLYYHPLHHIWTGMKGRCHNKTTISIIATEQGASVSATNGEMILRHFMIGE